MDKKVESDLAKALAHDRGGLKPERSRNQAAGDLPGKKSREDLVQDPFAFHHAKKETVVNTGNLVALHGTSLRQEAPY